MDVTHFGPLHVMDTVAHHTQLIYMHYVCVCVNIIGVKSVAWGSFGVWVKLKSQEVVAAKPCVYTDPTDVYVCDYETWIDVSL